MQSMHWFISHISVSWGPLSHTFFWYMYISKCHIDWWYVLSTRKGMWPTRRQIPLSWEKWPNNLPPLPLPCLHTTVLLLSRFGYVLPQGSRSRPREMISSFVNGTPHSPPLSPPLPNVHISGQAKLSHAVLQRPRRWPQFTGEFLEPHFLTLKGENVQLFWCKSGAVKLHMRSIWPFLNFNGF